MTRVPRTAGPTPPRTILLFLSLLPEGKWMFGLDMIKAAKHPHIARGTVYVRLMELEDAGYVRSRLARHDAFTRYEYQITSAGRAALLRDDL